MDYEEKYKKALEWMQDLYGGLHGATKEEAEHYFPELKESEAEMMLREIKRYIKEQGDKPTGLPNGTVPVSDMLAWLEKQGEDKHVDKKLKEDLSVQYRSGHIEHHKKGEELDVVEEATTSLHYYVAFDVAIGEYIDKSYFED